MVGMSVLSAETARESVRSLTAVRAQSIVELGRGTDSVAYLVDGEWVFRFPAVPDAQATLRREMTLLPHLRAALALRVPFFEHVGRREDGALLFVGYRVVSGVSLSAERFDGLGRDAQEAALAALAGFLQALHGVSLDLARRAGVVEERGKGAYNREQRHLHRRLARLLSPAEVARLDGVFERYERDHAPLRRAPVLLHADLKPDHVIYDRAAARVAGVLDWGDVCLGDPDFDLAVISMFFGERFLVRLLDHLPDRDPAVVLAKARFFTTVRWIQDALFVMARGDGEAVEACLRRLREHLRAYER
jgi:aminoglycoside 2''-phosphotransferase